MTKIFSFILLLTPLVLSAQRLKVVRIDHPEQSYHEKYQVLASDDSTRQGLYEKTYKKHKVMERGYYKNGEKDSLWAKFCLYENFILSQGYYVNGTKSGVWTVYKNKDTIDLKYDFTANKLLYFEPDTLKKYAVLVGRDTIYTKLLQPPLYLDGIADINSLLCSNLHYPDAARENNIQGCVHIGFIIYPDGHAGAPWIMESVHQSIDDEALRVAHKISGKWLPGILDGKAVTSFFDLPVVFKLE